MTTATRAMPSPLRYDLMIWWASRGKEHRFRNRQVELARIVPGDTVLDVGCGTGTLAIAAAKAVGPEGDVHGIDPSLPLLARATKKAHRAGVHVNFHTGTGGRLPFDDDSFDVVLCTLVFHHLDGAAMHATFGEVLRVIRPDGRLLVVDIGGQQDPARKTFHGGAGGFDLETFVPKIGQIGLHTLEQGAIESGIASLERLAYILATPK